MIWLVVAVMLAMGCSLQSGPAFKGRIFIHSDAIYEIRPSQNGKTAKIAKITDGNGAISPDGHWLLYSRMTSPVVGPDSTTPGETVLLDLASGEKRTLFEYEVKGIDWSPDGRRFSFSHQNKLLVSDLDGNAFPVYETAEVGYRSVTFKTVRVFPPTIPRWVSQDLLLFNSVETPPRQINELMAVAAPDTPHLMILDEKKVSRELKMPGTVFVASRCLRRQYVLVSDSSSLRYGEYEADGKNGKLSLTRFEPALGMTESRAVPSNVQDCRLVPPNCFLRCKLPEEEPGTAVFLEYDPETLAEVFRTSLSWKGRKLLELWDGPEEGLIAALFLENDLVRLALINIKTGGETVVLDEVESYFGASQEIKDNSAGARMLADQTRKIEMLAWLPGRP